MNWTEFKREYLKSINTKQIKDASGFPYEAFNEVPDSAKLKDDDIGKQVWVASKPRTRSLYLLEINDDHFKVKQRGRLKGGEPRISHLYKDEVIIHPNEWTKDRLGYE